MLQRKDDSMKPDNETRSGIIGIGTYVQYFQRELCTIKEFAEAKHVYKIIGTKESEDGELLVRMEKRFGDFHDLFIPAEDLFAKVDSKKYPYIRQEYMYEEITSNDPMYPLHPEDSKYLPIDRYEEGKYKENDIISVEVSNEQAITPTGSGYGMRVVSVMDENVAKSMDKEFQKKIDRGVGFITLPPDWYQLRKSAVAITTGVMAVDMLNPNDIVGVVLEIIGSAIKIRITQPGVFNRLVKDGQSIQAVRRSYKDPESILTYRDDIVSTVCYDLELPDYYMVND